MLRMLIALLFSGAAFGAFQCSQYNSMMGATFDLTDLVRANDQPAFTVEDGDIPCTTKVEQNYTYSFNICGPVPSDYVPPRCQGMSGVSGAAVLQVDKRGTADDQDDWCYLVGNYNDKTTALELLDQNNPTTGLKLTYFGDYCKGSNKPRQFQIQLQCADKLNPVPLHAYEMSPCAYTISMPSVYGCPLECPVANRHLCGGNGHCAYDDDKQGARCFCNSGYGGNDCSQTSTSSSTLNYSPALLGLIITLFIIVVVLIGGIVYMVRQMKAYQEDLANYQVLKGSEEESTAV